MTTTTAKRNHWLLQRLRKKYQEVLRRLEPHEHFVVDGYVFYRDKDGFLHHWYKDMIDLEER